MASMFFSQASSRYQVLWQPMLVFRHFLWFIWVTRSGKGARNLGISQPMKSTFRKDWNRSVVTINQHNLKDSRVTQIGAKLWKCTLYIFTEFMYIDYRKQQPWDLVKTTSSNQFHWVWQRRHRQCSIKFWKAWKVIYVLEMPKQR